MFTKSDAAMKSIARSRLTNNPSTRYLVGLPRSGNMNVPTMAITTAATTMEISGDFSLMLLRTNATIITISRISVKDVTDMYFSPIITLRRCLEEP